MAGSARLFKFNSVFSGVLRASSLDILRSSLPFSMDKCVKTRYLSADADSTLYSPSKLDVEKQFTDEAVQKLLADITGMDLHDKVFRPRRLASQQRAHYALMTDERLEKTMERMRHEASQFLQPVPFMEPRESKFEILSKDAEIAGFDQSRFVFTDITFDATDQDRAVVVREVDGTLRTANPEEHDRMNRVFYEKPNRPVNEPQIFSDPWLKNALDRGEHEFVMDWACWFFEPDDPAFVKLSRAVFDRTVYKKKFDALYSTRHFGTLAFYLALNGNIPPLLNWLGGTGRLQEAALLVKLQKQLHPNWRMAVSSSDSDVRVLEDYLRQNARLVPKLPDLVEYLKNGRSTDYDSKSAGVSEVRPEKRNVHAQVNEHNIGSTAGPLGSLSSEYPVNVHKAESTSEATTGEKGKSESAKKKRWGHRGRTNNRSGDKQNDGDQD